MQTISNDGKNNSENCPVTIGQIIEAELRRQERSVTWLSRKIHCDRRNVYDIFSRSYIDTGLLYLISQALGCDFFKYYSESLRLASVGRSCDDAGNEM